MRLLDDNFNDDLYSESFIDEFDRFDEFDIEIISRDYEANYELKNDVKFIDQKI